MARCNYGRLHALVSCICLMLLPGTFADVIESGIGNFLNHTDNFDASEYPSKPPTKYPTRQPSYSPTEKPSSKPTVSPTNNPTPSPSEVPSSKPSQSPSFIPSFSPSLEPSSVPTSIPTFLPTSKPSALPSYSPTAMPEFYAVFPFSLNQYKDVMSPKELDIFEATITDFASECVKGKNVDISSSRVTSQSMNEKGSVLDLVLGIEGRCAYRLRDTVEKSIVGCFDTNYIELTSQYEQRNSQKKTGKTAWIAVVISILCAVFIGAALFLYRKRKTQQDTIYDFSPHRMADLELPQLDTRNGEVVMGCSNDEEVIVANPPMGPKSKERNPNFGQKMDDTVNGCNPLPWQNIKDAINRKVMKNAGKGTIDVTGERGDDDDDTDSLETEPPLHLGKKDGYCVSVESSMDYPGGFHVSQSAALEASNISPDFIDRANLNSLMDTDSTVASSKKSSIKSALTTDIEKQVAGGFCCFSSNGKRVMQPEENFIDNPSVSQMGIVYENDEEAAVGHLQHPEDFQSKSNQDRDDEQIQAKIDLSPSLHRISESTAKRNATEIQTTISRLSSARLLLKDREKPFKFANLCSPRHQGSIESLVVGRELPTGNSVGYSSSNRPETNNYAMHHEDTAKRKPTHTHECETNRGHEQDLEKGPLECQATSDNSKADPNDITEPYQFGHKHAGRGRMASVMTGHEGELIPVHDFQNYTRDPIVKPLPSSFFGPIPQSVAGEATPPSTPRSSRGRTATKSDEANKRPSSKTDLMSPFSHARTAPMNNKSKSRSRSLSPPNSFGSSSSSNSGSNRSSSQDRNNYRTRRQQSQPSPQRYNRVYNPDRKEWVERKR